MSAPKSVDSARLEMREFGMTYQHFTHIRDIAYRLTGITLSDHKQNMVYGRLARRLRALGLSHFDDYCDLLYEQSPEITEFINAITTNLTAFFREMHHFEYLKKSILPALAVKNAKTRRLRIWSAGCSTGEEPYSLAMTLASTSLFTHWDCKILATDLDSNVVATAKAGLYGADRIDSIPAEYQRFVKQQDGDEIYKIKEDIQALITFKQLNLLNEWPMKGMFDVIFCRNVVIYFDQETQRKLFSRYCDILHSKGHLFIGHSENLNRVSDAFLSLGKTIYQKRS
jgi:chemotaxis protein methyltransferase CheR